MAGVVLETLSNKKLIAFTVLGCLCLFVCFLIGGLIAPSPYNVQNLLATKCIDKDHLKHKWFDPWPVSERCNYVDNFKEKRIYDEKISSEEIVFSIRFPLIKKNTHQDMSRWQQNIVGILQVDVDHDSNNPLELEEMSEMSIHARMGHRDKGEDKWTELSKSRETRHLKCETSYSEKSKDPIYKCDMLPLFELGSCHHDYYIINMRLPVDNTSLNAHLPMIQDIWIYAIHPNGGFTKVWVSLKTVMCPLVLAALIWHIYRIRQQSRPYNLLEKTLIAMGTAMSLLNLPIEYFTLYFYMPYMLLFSDVRQGIFYSVLLCFWIIFAGEHLMDQVERNRLVIYWKHLSVVAVGCIFLFVFEMCERGVQLTNPFFTIWATPTGAKVAFAFIIIAGIAACVYFLFLLYMIVMVFRNINAKKTSLPQMGKARKRFYMGLIYRFNFLMALTLICAAATVIFFILGQVSELYWKWDGEQSLEYTSAFMTGVYGMWNIYVLSLLVLYAPSAKHVAEATDASEDEVIEFANMPSEASALTVLAKKVEID